MLKGVKQDLSTPVGSTSQKFYLDCAIPRLNGNKKNQIILIEGSHTLTSNTDTNPSRLGGTGVLQCQIVSR